MKNFTVTVWDYGILKLDEAKLLEWVKKQKPWVYEISAKRLYKDRTDLQNRYYWGVVVRILSVELWYTPEEIHELLKDKLLTVRTKIAWTRKRLKRTKSTTELTTIEFNKFIEEIINYFMYRSAQDKKGGIKWIEIPLPNNEADMNRIIDYYSTNWYN